MLNVREMSVEGLLNGWNTDKKKDSEYRDEIRRRAKELKENFGDYVFLMMAMAALRTVLLNDEQSKTPKPLHEIARLFPSVCSNSCALVRSGVAVNHPRHSSSTS